MKLPLIFHRILVILQQRISLNSFSNRLENTVLLVSWRHRTFPMLTTRFSLKPIRPSLDASLNRRMLRRYAIFSKRAEETKIWLHNYQLLAQDNSRWLLRTSTPPLFQSNAVGCTRITVLHSTKIRLKTSFLLKFELGQSRVLLDERVEGREQPMRQVEVQLGPTETTRMNPRVLSKLHEFRPLEA